MISGLHQQAVVSIEKPEKGKRELMAQNDIGIDLARAFLIRRFGQDAKAGAVCSVLACLPRLR